MGFGGGRDSSPRALERANSVYTWAWVEGQMLSARAHVGHGQLLDVVRAPWEMASPGHVSRHCPASTPQSKEQ